MSSAANGGTRGSSRAQPITCVDRELLRARITSFGEGFSQHVDVADGKPLPSPVERRASSTSKALVRSFEERASVSFVERSLLAASSHGLYIAKRNAFLFADVEHEFFQFVRTSSSPHRAASTNSRAASAYHLDFHQSAVPPISARIHFPRPEPGSTMPQNEPIPSRERS